LVRGISHHTGRHMGASEMRRSQWGGPVMLMVRDA